MRLLTWVTYVVTLFAVTVWALPFGMAVWGLLFTNYAKVSARSFVFVAYPLCGLWFSAALPFFLREMGKPRFAAIASFACLFLGLLTGLILQ